MHCTACNVNLTDFEATRAYSNGDKIDLCNDCYSYISEDVDSNVRFDLMSESDILSQSTTLELTDFDDYNYSIYDDRELS